MIFNDFQSILTIFFNISARNNGKKPFGNNGKNPLELSASRVFWGGFFRYFQGFFSVVSRASQQASKQGEESDWQPASKQAIVTDIVTDIVIVLVVALKII